MEQEAPWLTVRFPLAYTICRPRTAQHSPPVAGHLRVLVRPHHPLTGPRRPGPPPAACGGDA
ncbi:hypothetical protein ATKI12_4440 [Kitasatospora sp. Ki12]